MKAVTKENHKTITINQEKMKSKRVSLSYEMFFQGNPSQAISKSRLVSSCNAEFDLMDSSSGSTTPLHISSTKLSTQRA